jgi:mannosyltransferase
MPPSAARRLAALAAITAVGAALRFGFLDSQGFWYDEAVTAKLVRMDLWAMLDSVAGIEATPPLYYLLAWGWAKLFGTGEFALRSLSALAGTATIPVAYAFVATILARRVALAVAVLAAVNPMLIWYSQEARSYSLLVLLSALSLLLFARLLEKVERRTLILWALVSALALGTHYFAAFLLVPQAVWLLTRTRRSEVVAAVGAVGAAGLALLPLALHQRAVGAGLFIGSASLPVRFARTLKQQLVGLEAPWRPWSPCSPRRSAPLAWGSR